MCGEKVTGICNACGKPGSPPRVRGKVRASAESKSSSRITPACAGKRYSGVLCAGWVEDHPRVCGEKPYPLMLMPRYRGSPPRVRGKVDGIGYDLPDAGITPACAGKRLKKAHKIKDFDPVPIRFHLVFRRFERWCSNLPTPDGNVPV